MSTIANFKHYLKRQNLNTSPISKVIYSSCRVMCAGSIVINYQEEM